ncbi:collagen alpha-3(VI) chain-like isoform X2 [Xenia sp. Carnegie-2017]|uniref:collagen alpha-3(VI) chain-like isoform X2 n=1 Tax=Xenia sp. Carnegie-2017 TaxID=2897299 RepID=UPI001F04137B|nr:collagen alpha-3(VI) chain-like isoform X2 [Xenia sp. Carnegie-2017]
MDVVFTFGACGPNADDVFDKEKDMVSGFLETIKVADSYYGVIEYGENQANIMARLGDFRNKERLNQFINTIPRSGEGRAIDKALEKARELLLGSGRNDARKALVIFANGKSSARLAELTKEAKPLHDAGVKIIAVGIGDDVDDEELNSIATNKIIAQPYDEAAPLGHLLAHEVTEAPSKELVDVTFVMGSSGIEGDMIFEKEKEIIQSFVDALKSNDTQIAVVNYGNDDAKVEAKVGQFKDKEDLMSCVNKQTRLGDGKALGKALDKTEKVLSETGRPGIRKAVVVFANGRSGSDNISLAKKARDLHGNDVKVVAVGIGDDVNEDELQALANAGVIMAGRDSDSDVTAGTIVKYLEMISEAAEDALDIAFAFGASGSDADLSFKKAKEMIKIFIDSLKVHDTQYGVIEYSNEARVHATFGQFNRKDRLKAQISSIERRGEAVGLHKALTAAYDLLAKNGRRGARKTLIVFTSGKADASLNEVRDSAKSLQDAGIKIVSVAIGDSADVSQLKEISTNEEVVKCELTGDSDAIIHRVSHDVVSAELSGETVDIVFALGSAGSDAHMVFEKEKEMVATFVNSLDTANLRYALVNYGEDATLQANFNDHKEKYDFKEFLDTLAWPGHGVGLANALEKSAAVFKDSGRVNAKRVLVLFTNAQSNARAQDLQKYSRDLQETAVKVIVVAIGDDVNEEELSQLNGQPMVRHQVHEDLNVIAKTLACDMLSNEADAVQTPVLSPIPKVKLDVVFAIGAAGKDANDVFEKEKLIVNSFIDNLKDNDAQFAIIEFGNKASVKSNLGDEMNAGILAASVADLQRSGEGKCLDKALEQAVEVFHQKARAGSNRVLIVLTNAKSSARTQDLKKHSQSLTDAGVKVQVVAIGNDINEDELVQITSNEIPLLRIQPYEDPHTVLKETAWIIGEKQDEYLDIVFAFGSFGEAAKEIFYKEKQLISSFIDSVQKPDTRYGVIEIGPRAKVCAMIGQYRDHVRLKRHVNLVRRTGDATGLDHALDVAAGMFENQARPNSRRVLVVFTNGKSGAKSEQVKQNSERLIKANVDIIVVAIGDDIDDEECQNVSCGNRPIVCIDPEQNPRAFVYSIVKEIEEVKCVKPTDIVFVIGAAGNGAENIYNKNKEIISKYIEANKVPNTMYSIVDYGPKAVVRSKFGENKQRAILLDHIENLQHPGDGKALDKALEQSLNLLENEGRFGAKKRAVLFTNGNSGASPGHLKKYSSLLEDANVKIITVAVGDDVNDSEIRHVNSDEETIVKVAVDDEPESAVFAVARLVQGPNKVKYDIIFAFGAMGESADMIHLKEKEMIGSFIDSFAAGDYRYAVVEYGSKAYVKAKFDEIRGKDEMKEFVKNIKRSGEGKALDKALEQSHDLFKKYGRPTAKNVLIVFTNGKCNARANELKKYATSLSELGTKLIVVAIGEEVSVDELLHVASNKESIVRAQPEDDCSQLFNSIVRDTIEERPVTDVDVVFALGTSGEHADEMFEKEKEFVNGFIDASNYGDTDYAFIEFCDPLKLHFSFKDFNNNKDIKNKICSLSRHGDGTSMAEALRKAHELFTNDSRSSSHKVLIVMTNGHLSGRAGELRNGAKALQKIGVKVITVAIGDDVDHDVIRQLSCDEGNVIHVKKDEDVGCLVYVITREAVKGTPVYDEVVKEETFLRQVFLQPRVNLILKPSTSTTEQAQIDEEAKRLEREQLEAEKRAEEETLKFEEIERQLEEKEEEARLEIERLEIEELERKQKENLKGEKAQRKKKEEEEELAMMQFAVATPETEIIRKAHERTLDLNEAVPES